MTEKTSSLRPFRSYAVPDNASAAHEPPYFFQRRKFWRGTFNQYPAQSSQGWNVVLEKDIMKKFVLIALAAGAAVSAVTPVDARGGCGVGYHRGPYGGCRLNRGPGPVVVAPGVPVLGVYYGGRGYWDGHRYWGHRYRWHGGWRYR